MNRFEIIEKEFLTDNIVKMKFYEPRISTHVKTGQFVVLIPYEKGERIPLTINKTNAEEGSVSIVFQIVGKSTAYLSNLKAGDTIYSVLGPLGQPSYVEKNNKKNVLIAGGLGSAIILPEMYKFKEIGNYVVSIIGARTKDLILFRDEFEKYSNEVLITTNDGSEGIKGFVTDALKLLLEKEADNIALVKAIGPNIMMQNVYKITKEYEIPTYVSLTAIMVDGTGMCGSCRVEINGEIKHTCIDGPEFLADGIDFDQLTNRNRRFAEQEKLSYELYKKVD